MKTGRKPIEKFINDQLSQWPLACDNFRALKDVRIRPMSIGGLDVRIQFNPARIVSSAADVSEKAIKERRCFLCRENRPAGQISLRFEGRKSKKYDILVNPYPIFPGHLVIASDRHVDQSIWKRYVDMLDLARALGGYTVFYNGPCCGASAPDHFHFQAASRGMMPLECDVDGMLDSIRDSDLEYLSSVQDAEVFRYRKFIRGVFVIRAATAKSAAKMFYRLLDCAPAAEEGKEPMFNLLTWYAAGEYRSVVIFRAAHRSSHYFSDNEDRLVISPGCADMAGVIVTPRQEDFDKLTPELLAEVYDEVSMSEEAESLLMWRLTRSQTMLSVGIMSAKEIEFEIISDGAGPRKAVFNGGKIEYDGALYDELYFDSLTPSMMFAEPAFILYGVTIGNSFHWQRKENQKFAGALKIIVEKDALTAVNVIGVEDYLLSVISSEMKSTASEEFLKAHAVISRSWVMSLIGRRNGNPAHGGQASGCFPEEVKNLPSVVTWLDSLKGSEKERHPASERGEWIDTVEHIKWYGHDDHKLFDVCADDHCQRYQGLTRVIGNKVRKVIDATWGQVLTYGGRICDARFSKCCGGRTEKFSVCWENEDFPYLQSVGDSPESCSAAGIRPAPGPVGEQCTGYFCNTSDMSVLTQVLNDYDLETMDFFEWKAEYDRRELSALISGKLGIDIGELLALIPLERGDSGRISLLEIIGTGCSVRVGKELEIRKVLSDTHLKSSAFEVSYYDSVGMMLPADAVAKEAACYRKTGRKPVAAFDRVVLSGRGWGHGVGLCQIGAAVMSEKGYGYKDILAHYYRGAEVSDAFPERRDGIETLYRP